MSEKIYTIDEIKAILNRVLQNQPVYKVVLFGSYAKNEATKKSDIDLVIDTRKTLKGFNLIKLICLIQDALNREIDGFEEYEIVKDSKIDEEIKNTGVIVYER